MNKNVSLKHIVVSLIEAIDSYNYLLKDHHRHTAIIAYQLGSEFGLEKRELDNLVLAASLHDIGALYVKEKEMLIQADVEMPDEHEILGGHMLASFAPFHEISQIVRHHHIRYDDFIAEKYNNEDINQSCYIINLADRIDVLRLIYGTEPNPQALIIEEIRKRFGTVFAPFLETTFEKCIQNADFWVNIEEESFHHLLLRTVNDDLIEWDSIEMEELGFLFARIIDFRSHWTMSHSVLVGTIAARIAEIMGLSEDEVFELKMAGYLHDIGKIAIATELIDKPDVLTQEEYAFVKRHVIYTENILAPIQEFEKIYQLASRHHERRDRSGYPLKLGQEDFTIQMDILSLADIFAALFEDRPYRRHLDKQRIVEVMEEYVPEKLSIEVYRVVFANLDELLALAESIKENEAVM